MAAEIKSLEDLDISFNTSGNIPAVPVSEIAKAGESVSTAQSKLVDSVISTRGKAADSVGSLQQVFAELNTQIDVRKDAKVEAANIAKQTTVAAAEGAKDAVTFYNESINGTAANKRRQSLLNNVREAENALAANAELMQTGNFLQRNFSTVAREPLLQRDLINAQNELERFQSANANSVRAMGNAAVAANTAAQLGSAADRAEQERIIAASTAHIEALHTKGNVTKQQLEVWGQQIGFDVKTMQGLNQELDTLIKTNQGTAAAFQAAYQKAQKEEFTKQVKSRKVDNEELLRLQNQYFEFTGRKELIGTFKDAETLARNFPQVNAAFQQWFLRSNTTGKAVWTNLIIKRETASLEDADNNLYRYSTNLVESHNQRIRDDIRRKIAEDPTLREQDLLKQAEAELLDVNDASHYGRIDQLVASEMAYLNEDATPAINIGSIIIPDAKVLLEQVPTFEENMRTELPVSAYQTFIDAQFKDVDWSLPAENPAGGFEGIVEVIGSKLEAIEKSDSSGGADAAARNLAQSAAKYYERLRILLANSSGFTGLSSISIKGVSVRQAGMNDALSGAPATQKVNLENPADWLMMFQRERRKRKVDASSTQAKQALSSLEPGIRQSMLNRGQ